MNKNKKNNVKLILLMIIIGVILISLGLITLNLIRKNGKSDNLQEENNVKEENKIIVEVENDIPEGLQKKHSQITKYTDLLDSNFSKIYPIENISYLNSQDKTLFLLNALYADGNEEISVSQLLKEMTKYFLPFELYLGNIINQNGVVLYEYSDGKFTYEISDDTSSYEIYTEEVSNKASIDSWIVQRKIYYVKSKMEDNKLKLDIYANPNTDEILYSYTSSNNTSIPGLTPEDYLKIKDKLSTITYTYKKVGENYLIESIIIN